MEEDKEVFIRDIKKMTADLVSEVEKSKLKFEPSFSDGKKCPFCGEMMMRDQDRGRTPFQEGNEERKAERQPYP